MKKPDIFKPNVDVNNNKKVYYSFLDDRLKIESELDRSSFDKNNLSPLEFIDNLSKSDSYMFSKNVIIKTCDKTYDTRIAGKIGDRIITLDNDSININDILDIYYK